MRSEKEMQQRKFFFLFCVLWRTKNPEVKRSDNYTQQKGTNANYVILGIGSCFASTKRQKHRSETEAHQEMKY
jgi:hypothetical protein